ncbi:transposase [Leptolyngbya sp. PCC 6406]|uniref:transposase n=1 Tax=Leptolyngbya sp. PCC 6406 TaxID=1173264 RepID=UPI0002ABAAB3|nr:transposase [Leptolyngbya sp. PCC 6406]
MVYDPDRHRRRSLRLRHHDYSTAGAYFITLCIQSRSCLLGKIGQGHMQLNPAGFMVEEIWRSLPQRFDHVDLDAFVVMPNHMHGILVLTEGLDSAATRAGTRPAPTDLGVVGTNTEPAPMDPPSSRPDLDSVDTRAGTRPAPTVVTRAGTRPVPTGLGTDRPQTRVPLGTVVGVFKSLTTHQYTKGVKDQNWIPFQKRLWQRNYYEHIIRTPADLDRIRTYIHNNPKSWETDQLHPRIP